jgi:hypothetical protein
MLHRGVRCQCELLCVVQYVLTNIGSTATMVAVLCDRTVCDA